MTPTETLVHEHNVILLVVEAATREAAAIRENRRVDAARVAKMADFFAGFADTCHHAKEEKLLFPLLEKRGADRMGCPIVELAEEHETGRAHVRAIRAALTGAADEAGPAREVADHLAEYANLLREHIRKENEVLFPCADRVLSGEDQRELARGFERVEAEETGAALHEHYYFLAHELAGRQAA